MDSILSFFRSTTSQPITDNLSSSTTAEKIAILENALNIDHCSTSTLLGALKLTCPSNENKSTEPATSEFAKTLSQRKLSSTEIQLLQKSLIAHLPDVLREQAKAIVTADMPNTGQSGNQLSAWIAVNHIVANLLENIPDIKNNPFAVLDALAYSWGYAPSKELYNLGFQKQFERAKEEHLSNLAHGSEEFAKARNGFNNAVREQLVMFFPAIKKQYHHINSSDMSYEQKKYKTAELLCLHFDLNEAIGKISWPGQRNPSIVECKAMLALCDNNLFTSCEDHELETGSLAALKARYINSQANAGTPEKAADVFEDALMRAFAMGLFRDQKNACLNILDSAKSVEEMKLEIKSIVSPYYGSLCRMSQRI